GQAKRDMRLLLAGTWTGGRSRVVPVNPGRRRGAGLVAFVAGPRLASHPLPRRQPPRGIAPVPIFSGTPPPPHTQTTPAMTTTAVAARHPNSFPASFRPLVRPGTPSRQRRPRLVQDQATFFRSVVPRVLLVSNRSTYRRVPRHPMVS